MANPTNIFSLTDLLPLNDFPEEMAFIRAQIESLYQDFFFQNFMSHRAPSGAEGYFYLELVFAKNLSFDLVGNLVTFQLFPGHQDGTPGKLPIYLYYQWNVVHILNQLNLEEIPQDTEEWYQVFLNFTQLSPNLLLTIILDEFFEDAEDPLQALIETFPGAGLQMPDETTSDPIQDLIDQMIARGAEPYEFIFQTFIDSATLGEPLIVLGQIFGSFSGLSYSPDILIQSEWPALTLIVRNIPLSIRFSRDLMIPLKTPADQEDGIEPTIAVGDPLPISYQSELKVILREVILRSKSGFDAGDAIDVIFRRSRIPKLGLTIGLEGCVIDISRETTYYKIAALGFGADFVGFYAEEAFLQWLPQFQLFGGDVPGITLDLQDLAIGNQGFSFTMQHTWSAGSLDPTAGNSEKLGQLPNGWWVAFSQASARVLYIKEADPAEEDLWEVALSLAGLVHIPFLDSLFSIEFSLFLEEDLYAVQLGIALENPPLEIRPSSEGSYLRLDQLEASGKFASDGSFGITGASSGSIDIQLGNFKLITANFAVEQFSFMHDGQESSELLFSGTFGATLFTGSAIEIAIEDLVADLQLLSDASGITEFALDISHFDAVLPVIPDLVDIQLSSALLDLSDTHSPPEILALGYSPAFKGLLSRATRIIWNIPAFSSETEGLDIGQLVIGNEGISITHQWAPTERPTAGLLDTWILSLHSIDGQLIIDNNLDASSRLVLSGEVQIPALQNSGFSIAFALLPLGEGHRVQLALGLLSPLDLNLGLGSSFKLDQFAVEGLLESDGKFAIAGSAAGSIDLQVNSFSIFNAGFNVAATFTHDPAGVPIYDLSLVGGFTLSLFSGSVFAEQLANISAPDASLTLKANSEGITEHTLDLGSFDTSLSLIPDLLFLHLKSVLLDLDETQSPEPIIALGFGADFQGVYSEASFLDWKIPGLSIPGLDPLGFSLGELAMGNNFELRLQESWETNPPSAQLFEDWEIVLLALGGTLSFKDELEGSLSLACRTTLPFLNIDTELQFHLLKSNDDFEVELALILSEIDLPLEANAGLRIDYLELRGRLATGEEALTLEGNLVSGSLTLPGMTALVIENATSVFTYQEGNYSLQVDVQGLALEIETSRLLTIDATLELTGTDAGITSARIVGESSWEDLSQQPPFDKLPADFPVPGGGSLRIEFSWEEEKSSLLIVQELEQLENLWPFVPDSFAPTSPPDRPSRFVFEAIFSDNPDIANTDLRVEVFLTLPPAIRNIVPLKNLLELPELFLLGITIDNLFADEPGFSTRLIPEPPLEIRINLPIDNFPNPLVLTQINGTELQSEAINGTYQGVWMIWGAVASPALLDFVERADPNLRQLIPITAIEMTFGVRGLQTDEEPEVFFHLGPPRTASDGPLMALNFITDQIPGLDAFMNILMGGEDLDLSYRDLLESSNKKGDVIDQDSGQENSTAQRESKSLFEISNLSFLLPSLDRMEELGGFSAGLAVDLKVMLGPLQVLVQEIGLEVLLSTKNRDDFPIPYNFLSFRVYEGQGADAMDVFLALKPPLGLGLSMNTPVVRAGGFISLEIEKQRYVGMLEVEVVDMFSLVIIGLLTTNVGNAKPEEPPFSLLLIITSEFPPIDLGFGFVLMGVGGLLGINRMLRAEELRVRVSSGAVNSILFPRNVIANADQIISDLRAIFPPEDGRFLFGPMIKVGWGSGKPLISISLGLIIEIEARLGASFELSIKTLTILGRLGMILPDEEERILAIEVVFAGIWEFDTGLLSFDAALYKSTLLTFPLEGNMAVRLKYQGESVFVLVVGGFHPNYQLPPMPVPLPPLKKVSLKLFSGDNPRADLESYMAITTNAIMFGGRLDVYYNIANAGSAEGYLSFDALMIFKPLYFSFVAEAKFEVRVRIQVKVKIKIFGLSVKFKFEFRMKSSVLSVNVRLNIEGPRPYIIEGYASFKVFGVSLKIDFKKTFGQRIPQPRPLVDIYPQLEEALTASRNWQSLKPRNGNLPVSVRPADVSDAVLLIHPISGLSVSQQVVPLALPLEIFGVADISGARQFDITGLEIPGAASVFAPGQTLQASFARGHFRKMSDEEKLSKPSFESFTNGYDFGGEAVRTSPVAVLQPGGYEYRYRDEDRQLQSEEDNYQEDPRVITAMKKNNALADSTPGRNNQPNPTAPVKVDFNTKRYLIVQAATLEPLQRNKLIGSWSTEDPEQKQLYYSNRLSAEQALAQISRQMPWLEDEIDIINAAINEPNLA